MIRLNCDIGERGADNPVDRELMAHIHIANLACGGHAGDRESVKAFRNLAVENRVEISAHLSYPDRENFGRESLDIPAKELLDSLRSQYGLLPDIRLVKLHGALYNDSCRDTGLARTLAGWLQEMMVHTIITAAGSELAKACIRREIAVLPEAFAERRYRYFPETGRLALVSRTKDYASIGDCDEAVEQTEEIVRRGRVRAVVESRTCGKQTDDTSIVYQWVPIRAETICIHSDSPISLDLARRLEGVGGWQPGG
jgi:UPF0271 protein